MTSTSRSVRPSGCSSSSSLRRARRRGRAGAARARPRRCSGRRGSRRAARGRPRAPGPPWPFLPAAASALPARMRPRAASIGARAAVAASAESSAAWTARVELAAVQQQRRAGAARVRARELQRAAARGALGALGEPVRGVVVGQRDRGAGEQLEAARLVQREGREVRVPVGARELRAAARGLADLEQRLRQLHARDPRQRAAGGRRGGGAALAEAHRLVQVAGQQARVAADRHRPARHQVARGQQRGLGGDLGLGVELLEPAGQRERLAVDEHQADGEVALSRLAGDHVAALEVADRVLVALAADLGPAEPARDARVVAPDLVVVERVEERAGLGRPRPGPRRGCGARTRRARARPARRRGPCRRTGTRARPGRRRPSPPSRRRRSR